MERLLRHVMVTLFAAGSFACATQPPTPTRVVYSDDGRSELEIPEGWSERADFGQDAALRVGDGARDSYLMVNTYLPHEIAPATLPEFAERASAAIRDNMQDARMSRPRELKINGHPAVEHEISGRFGDTAIAYLSTVVEGRRARYHHLIAWTSAARYAASRDHLRAIVGSFRESANPRPAQRRVDLTFDWPAPLKAKIESYRKEDKGTESFEIYAQGVTTVRPAGAGRLRVRTRVTRHRMTPEIDDKDKADYLQGILQQAMAGVPDYLVTTGGDFVGIENLSAYHRRIEQAVLKGLPDGPEPAQARAQQLVRTLLSEDVLAASMEDEWNNAVGAWSGGSYVPGKTYRFVGEYRAPALGNQAFPMSVTQQLKGSVPCRPPARTEPCVRLVQTARVAGPAFTDATRRFVNRTVGNGVSVERIEVVRRVELVTDPKTLMPYEVTATQTKNIAVSAGGETRRRRETRESSTVYTYVK